MKSISELSRFKQENKKISMVTCYDHWSAQILRDSPIDLLLVGDSVSMVVHGFESTVHATIEMMATHTSAVKRAKTQKMIVTDLPFLVHRSSKKDLINSVDQLMKAGASALKIEAAPGQEKVVRYLSDSGVPMIGHVGLTPQYVHQLGGYKVQGRDKKTSRLIFDHSKRLQEAGCHALVLECVPSELAQKITDALSIPTIGIGAGPFVDGQVLVLQDLLGFNEEFKPRFVRQFAQGHIWMKEALEQFSQSVANQSFPSREESFQ
jgi:3-methyl-2-oxobutanoate hydroxymethyltransferase